MSTIPHPPTRIESSPGNWADRVLVRETWASLAIFAMWVAVSVSAVWGGDLVSTSESGTYTTTIPSGIVVAVLATIGSWLVAKYGLARRPEHED